MTKYKLYDRPLNGSTGQDCGAFSLAELSARIQDVIASNPSAVRWTLPALGDGDSGEPLQDLETVITLL